LATIEDDWKTGAEKVAEWQKTERKLAGGKGDTEAKKGHDDGTDLRGSPP
jgi:hypothetical protein